MSLNSLLLVAASAAGAMGYQGPGFDSQFAIPSSLDKPAETSPVPKFQAEPAGIVDLQYKAEPNLSGNFAFQPVFQAAAYDAKVSVQFNNAKIGDAVAWMNNYHVNYVLSNKDLRDDLTITLNAVDQPISDVADAIAAALGGHWEKLNAMRVFKSGPDMNMQFGGGLGGSFEALPAKAPAEAFFVGKALPAAPAFDQVFVTQDAKAATGPTDHEAFSVASPMAQMQGQMFGGQPVEIWIEQDGKMKKLKVTSKGGPIIVHVKDGKVEIEAQKGEASFGNLDIDGDSMHESIAKAMDEAKVEMMKVKADPAMSKEIEAQVQKAMAQAHVEIEKAMKAQAGGKAMTAEQAKEMAMAKDEMKRAMADAHIEIAKAMKEKDLAIAQGMKAKDFAIDAETRAEIAKAMADAKANGKTLRFKIKTKAGHGDEPSPANLQKLMDSLTSEQKQTIRMRGYVLYIDLTPAQKELLGKVPSGRFVVKYKVNDNSLEIHGS